MHVPRRSLSLLAFALALAWVLAACSPGPDVAATVGDVDITHAQVKARADLFRFLGSLSQQPCGTPVEGETANAACARFALGNLVQSELTGAYARQNEIELGPQAVDDALAGLESSAGEGGLDPQLEAAGLTRSDVEELAVDALIGQEVASAIAEETLGDDALRSEYDSRPVEFTATIEVQHILVGTQAEANDAYDRVTASDATDETFAEVAREVSTDAGSAQNGGGYEARPPSDYVPEFAEVAVALEPGEIASPVQTQFGWHVIRLVEKQEIPFEQARDQLAQELSATEFQDLLRERAQALGVEANPRYGRFDLQTLQVEAVRSTDPGATDAPSGAGTATGPTGSGATGSP